MGARGRKFTLQHERHRRILDLVKSRKTCTIDDLREELGISTITLYRDLHKLDESNVIRRVRGGVTLREPDPAISRFADRLAANAAGKGSIGQTAAAMVQENSRIFVDASSTCYYFAQHLAQRSPSRLTLVTSSPSIPLLFEACPGIRIISTGGELHQMLNAYGGPIAVRVSEEMNFDAAFISCAGFDLAHGATTDSPVLVELLRKVATRAREVVLLVDSSKFSRLAMMTSLRADEITKIVTDSEIPDDVRQRFLEAGIEVITAGIETPGDQETNSLPTDEDSDARI